MRKPDFRTCENKAADQHRGNREADQRLCFRYTESTIPLLPKSAISSLWLYSPVCVGPGREPRRPVFSRRGSIGVCNEVRIHPSVTPINRLTREKVLIMKTDELLRRCICRVFTFYFFIMLYAPSMIACGRRFAKETLATRRWRRLRWRWGWLQPWLKMTLSTDSRSLHRRRIPAFVGFRRRPWLTTTLPALMSDIVDDLVEFYYNHANGPFQDHTSFQERWPCNVLSWLLSLLPYQFNPVQNKHSLHWFIHFPPKFRLVLVYDAQSRITRVWSVFKEKSVIFSKNNADGLIQVAMKRRPRNYRVLYIGSALFPPDLTLKIRCVLYASAHNTQRSTVYVRWQFTFVRGCFRDTLM